MATSTVDWYGAQVMLRIDRASAEFLAQVALLVEGQAKINIQENRQIDTGFMLNSVYAVTKEGSTYAQALAAAQTQTWSQKQQRHVPHAGQLAPPVHLPRQAQAAVAVGAEYAIYQELKKSFLYKALAQVVKQVGGVVETVQL